MGGVAGTLPCSWHAMVRARNADTAVVLTLGFEARCGRAAIVNKMCSMLRLPGGATNGGNHGEARGAVANADGALPCTLVASFPSLLYTGCLAAAHVASAPLSYRRTYTCSSVLAGLDHQATPYGPCLARRGGRCPAGSGLSQLLAGPAVLRGPCPSGLGSGIAALRRATRGGPGGQLTRLLAVVGSASC